MGQRPWEGASRSYLVPKMYYRFTVALNYLSPVQILKSQFVMYILMSSSQYTHVF